MEIKNTNKLKLTLPKEILDIAKKLKDSGFSAYLIGGCVRDCIMNRTAGDWDFTTNAKPEEIQEIFEHTVCENRFGTVGVVNDSTTEDSLKVVEITTYRTESEYFDNRRPNEVKFSDSLEEDLSRRDFTINALAYDPIDEVLVDLHQGVLDLNKGLIKAIGDADERFKEDALRLMRAVRIATQLNGKISDNTFESIKRNASLLKNIAKERIRDELKKIILSNNPEKGIFLLKETDLLQYIIPELLEGVDIEQNQAHKYDVFEHNVRTLEHSAVKDLRLKLRLASLLHDISKPETREWSKEKNDWTFYNHEVVGAKVSKRILKRLCFSNDIVNDVWLFVRWHMFFSDTEKVTLSGVRRIVARVGEDKIWDLIDLRKCDRIGTGRPKEQPYRLRKYISLVEEVLREPITPGVLKIDGDVLINKLNLKPGPHIGNILHVLLEEVLENPDKNTEDLLLKRAKELLKIPTKDLENMGKMAKLKKQAENEEEVRAIRDKYGVN